MQQIKKWAFGEELLHEYGETVRECAEHAVASGTKLNYAELNGAKLNFAKLEYAELNHAKLNGAKLECAELDYAELNGAVIETASFVHSDMRFCSRDENAKLAHLNVCEWPVSIQYDGIHIGCKCFSLEEILAMTEHIAATHNVKAPIRWRRWGKAIQELAKATLG